MMAESPDGSNVLSHARTLEALALRAYFICLGGHQMKKNLKKNRLKNHLKQMMIIYPSVFAVMLLAFGLVHNEAAATAASDGSFTLVMDEQVPYGSALSAPTPVSCREEKVNSVDYVFVYEKETQQYLVYSGFDCLGCIVLDYGASLNDYTGDELLGLMQPLSTER
jgi:hypothetical protein